MSQEVGIILNLGNIFGILRYLGARWISQEVGDIQPRSKPFMKLAAKNSVKLILARLPCRYSSGGFIVLAYPP